MPGVAGAGLLRQVALPLRAETFAEVPPEPPIDVVDTIAARIKASGSEAVIALGGGSVMDAAKVASLCVRHGKAAREFVGIGKAGSRGLPTVLIPTTAGTGSEATFVAVLTDLATGNKVGVVDPCILADIAIVDPALTDGLPAQVTAAAGIDALVHAIEAFIAQVATPLARGLALEAARAGARWKWSAASRGTPRRAMTWPSDRIWRAWRLPTPRAAPCTRWLCPWEDGFTFRMESSPAVSRGK